MFSLVETTWNLEQMKKETEPSDNFLQQRMDQNVHQFEEVLDKHLRVAMLFQGNPWLCDIV